MEIRQCTYVYAGCHVAVFSILLTLPLHLSKKCKRIRTQLIRFTRGPTWFSIQISHDKILALIFASNRFSRDTDTLANLRARLISPPFSGGEIQTFRWRYVAIKCSRPVWRSIPETASVSPRSLETVSETPEAYRRRPPRRWLRKLAKYFIGLGVSPSIGDDLAG